MTTETRTSKTVTRTLKISAGLCVGAIAMGSAAVLVSSPAFAGGTLPTPNAPTPTFTSNSTFTAPAGAVYEVPANGFHFTGLQNVTINGGTWVDPNTWPGDTHGHGAALGRAAFDILGGSGITLENMTIEGANTGGYNPKLAFNSAINADGTSGLTVSGDNVSHVFGDCLTLGGWYQGVDPNVTVTPDTNVTVTNFNGQVCGLQGIALTDVNGVTASNVTIGASGEESLNFESDTVGIGAKNVTFTGCSLDKPVNIAAAGKHTGPITISDCSIGDKPTGDAVIASNINDSAQNGPVVFDNDAITCGASDYVACIQDTGLDVTVENSTVGVGTPDVPERVYTAVGQSILAFGDDTVSGYFTKTVGTAGPDATVTVTGGDWQQS